MTEITAQAAMDKARKLLDARVDAVRPLAEAYANLTSVRAAVTDAEQAAALAYRDAEKAGWTADELKAVGFDAPSRRAPGRPRAPRGARGSGTSTPDGTQRNADTDQ